MTQTQPNVAMLACLALLLSSCANTKPVTVTEVEYLTPPAALLQPIPEPECIPATWGDLFDCWIQATTALRQANAQLLQLRAWP